MSDKENEMNRIRCEIERYKDLIACADPDNDDYDSKVSEWEQKISNLESRLSFFD